MNCVVADAGPLIALAKLELLDIPSRIFGQILVPQTVLDECREQVYSHDAMLISEVVNNVFPTPVGMNRTRFAPYLSPNPERELVTRYYDRGPRFVTNPLNS